MVFNMEARIPWDDGAVLIFKRPTEAQNREMVKKVKEEGGDKAALYSAGAKRIECMLSGWENINGGDGKPLEFNDETRYAVFVAAMENELVYESVISFARGPLPNSKAGSTASLNTNGHQTNAADASETKTEKADVK